jgi:O-antigen/teichoic acid export membrane protein
MTPEASIEAPELSSPTAPSRTAAGMTAPMVIKLLGSEGYGILILVGLIPSYLSFSDLGMGVASTKFSSEAVAQGDESREASVVATATSVAFTGSFIAVLPIIIFAREIASAMNVPANMLSTASLALQLTCGSFVFGILSNIINSPELARLRMDVNALITATSRIVLALGTVIVLWLGMGIVGAALFGLLIGILTIGGHLVAYRMLIGRFPTLRLEKALVRPLLRFGVALAVSSIAVTILINLEKGLLTRLTSVQSLSYFSVAATLAGMVSLGLNSFVTALLPALSRLTAPDAAGSFRALFARLLRLSIICVFPPLSFLIVIADPFFSKWAGPDFGANSTIPFYLLSIGLAFNLIGWIPQVALTAVGRTEVLPKLYWCELPISAAISYLLISRYGVIGAALGWLVRAIIDALVILLITRKVLAFSFGFLRNLRAFLLAAATFLPAIVPAVLGFSPLIVVPLWAISFAAFAMVGWRWLVESDEKSFLIHAVTKRFRAA